MLKVAMIGKWHVHAKDYTRMLLERSDRAVITCVWDDVETRGREWADETGSEFVRDYDALLGRADVDAVVVTTATSQHRDIMVKAAHAKKHIFTEKVLAPTVKECGEIAQAIRENNVQFCISYPQMETPEFLYAKGAVESGSLGELGRMRVRNGHDGATANWLPEYWYEKAKACGGVLMDLGCHPMYLCSWFMGRPVSVSAQFSYLTGHEVEDNAVCAISFANGASAIVESSFTAPCSPYIMELYGTKGTILIVDGHVEVRHKENGEQRCFTPDALPPRPLTGIDQWIRACEGGAPAAYDLDTAIRLTELMEGAYIAQAGQKTYFFPDKA